VEEKRTDDPLASVEFADAAMWKKGLLGLRIRPTAFLSRAFQHPAACEVRALVCGEIEYCVSGGLYNTQKEDCMRMKQQIDGKSKGTPIHESRGLEMMHVDEHHTVCWAIVRHRPNRVKHDGSDSKLRLDVGKMPFVLQDGL
jgi:hypothetical protein